MDLIKVINSVLENNGLSIINSINESDNLKDDLSFDSFMLAELTVEIEELTGIDIFENNIVTTIGEIKKVLNG
jgi:acyl carrier protein